MALRKLGPHLKMVNLKDIEAALGRKSMS